MPRFPLLDPETGAIIETASQLDGVVRAQAELAAAKAGVPLPEPEHASDSEAVQRADNQTRLAYKRAAEDEKKFDPNKPPSDAAADQGHVPITRADLEESVDHARRATRQLTLIDVAEGPEWKLDDVTREVGRQGVAAARVALEDARSASNEAK